jgi:NADH:ubiquinone oxidoreductase subunit 5 (subunit L)/multisubunit Na+/H+ antiporter MnhA subunit
MLQQASFKRILAFSSVAQMGYAVLGLAMGTPLGLAAAALHLVHHALVKTALFMAAGLITLRLHIHTLDEGGGLARRIPITTLLVCLAGLSLSGLPFGSGYISKTMLEEAAVEAGLDWAAAIAVAGSLLTFAGMARLVYRLFFGPAPAHTGEPRRREFAPLALAPLVVLVAASLGMGLFPLRLTAGVAWPAAGALLEADAYTVAVMGGAVTDTPGVEWRAEAPPNPWDWHHWGIPAGVVAGGSALAYLLVSEPRRRLTRWATPAAWLGKTIRHWHSGVLNDYAFWTTFGTALLLAVLVAGMLLQLRG